MKIELQIKLFEGSVNCKTLKRVYYKFIFKKKSEQLNNLHK